MENKVPATMATMALAHKEIPGNPSVAKSNTQKLNDRSNGKPLRVLSEEDWKFWIYNGYIVIKNAVPKENCERLANLLWEFEEKDPNDPSTWYAPPHAEISRPSATVPAFLSGACAC